MKNQITGIIAILFAIVLFSMMIPVVIQKIRFQQQAVTTKGIVVGQLSRAVKTGLSYAPVVEFSGQDGQKITFESENYRINSSYTEGDEVTVSYLKGNPSEAIIKDFWLEWSPPLMFLGIGLIALFGGILLLTKKIFLFS